MLFRTVLDQSESEKVGDSIVLDCIDCTSLPRLVSDTYDVIAYRLSQAGIFSNSRIAFVAQPEIIELFVDDYPFELCADIFVGDDAYLLTLSAGNEDFVQPPLGMTWNDYFNSLSRGMNIKPLRILAPWAQAKFINVEAIK